MNFQKLTPIVNKPNAWALSPLVVFYACIWWLPCSSMIFIKFRLP